ncbi:hypothetical protein JYU34_019399 [Plutella xylostella]|uniref:Uncharacterized protein n=1 Tax=Plutella xylostella TaxID=51655 RepID=A0ABQ7PWQ8_PLUXY|nr:hypothetical protein JYU34_019399 [Plutella xylostella]
MGPKLVVTSYVLGRLRVVVKYLGGRRTRDRRLGEATLTAAPARDRHVAVRDVTDTSPTTVCGSPAYTYLTAQRIEVWFARQGGSVVVGIFTIGFPLFCAAIQGVAPTTCGGVDPHQLVRKVMRLMPSLAYVAATQDGGYATRLPDDDDVDEENDN